MRKAKGMVFAIISALIFGFTPIMVRETLTNGSNVIMTSFLRGFFVIPFLIISLKSRNVSLKVTNQELKKLILMCSIGGCITMTMLYASYQYISVGLATSIHFIFPTIVTVYSVMFLNEKMTKYKFISLIASIIGVILLANNVGGSSNFPLGMFLAVASGCTYSFYLIYMDVSGLKNMDSVKVTFYNCTINSTMLLVFGLITGDFTLSLSRYAWIIAFVISILVSVFGTLFIQLSIVNAGVSTYTIFSTLEPITSVILGIILFNETTDPRRLLGCFMIFLSVMILAVSTRFQERRAKGSVNNG
ncbi:DMT family transporter [Finegoldia magna]|uniref:DMT family transporter n=1 Tax=Finegoldia magna TaxID=1260 RepID=UPI000B91838C|nr:DMT family transporter [Finegoldia magna]OXZ36256.1 EamA family transporter [Finegoldia magna]